MVIGAARFLKRCCAVMTLLVSIVGSAAVQGEARGGCSVNVGTFKVITLSDGINQRSVEQQIQMLYGNKAMIKEALERSYPMGQIEGTVNAFLVDTGTKLVLIDSGNGSMGSPSMGKVMGNLRAAGYQPEQIDEIYLTHMHGDHVGGLLAGSERAFSKATVYAQQQEADFWLNDSNRSVAPEVALRTFQAAQEALRPYIKAGKFKTFTENGELMPGIRAEHLAGHTPGHTAYIIESNGAVLVLWGDIIHVAAVQFADPRITIAYDNDQEQAAKSRQHILAQAAARNWLVGGAHIAFPGMGRIRANGDGYEFTPLVIPVTP